MCISWRIADRRLRFDRMRCARQNLWRMIEPGHRANHGTFGWRSTIQLQIVGAEEASAQPASDVVEHGSCKADVAVGGNAARLKPRVDQFIDQHLQRHSVLQSDREGESEAVHHTGQC